MKSQVGFMWRTLTIVTLARQGVCFVGYRMLQRKSPLVSVGALMVLLMAACGATEQQAIPRGELAAIASRTETLVMARWTTADEGGYERDRDRLRSELAHDFIGNGITPEMLMALLCHDFEETKDLLGLTNPDVPYLAADALPLMMTGGEEAVGAWLWRIALSEGSTKRNRELVTEAMMSGRNQGLSNSAKFYVRIHFRDMLTEMRAVFARGELSAEAETRLLTSVLPYVLISRTLRDILKPLMHGAKPGVSIEDLVAWVQGQGGVEKLDIDAKIMADIVFLDDAVCWLSAWAAGRHPQNAHLIVARITRNGLLPLTQAARQRMPKIPEAKETPKIMP